MHLCVYKKTTGQGKGLLNIKVNLMNIIEYKNYSMNITNKQSLFLSFHYYQLIQKFTLCSCKMESFFFQKEFALMLHNPEADLGMIF